MGRSLYEKHKRIMTSFLYNIYGPRNGHYLSFMYIYIYIWYGPPNFTIWVFLYNIWSGPPNSQYLNFLHNIWYGLPNSQLGVSGVNLREGRANLRNASVTFFVVAWNLFGMTVTTYHKTDLVESLRRLFFKGQKVKIGPFWHCRVFSQKLVSNFFSF